METFTTIFILTLLELVSFINAEDDVCYTDHRIQNMALGKSTYSSSVVVASSFSVDGKQLFDSGDCFVSASETRPWMAVDLQTETAVSTVVVMATNMDDIFVSVLVGKTFDPATFDPSMSGFSQCGGEYDRVRTRTLFHIHCYQTLVGRYVVLQAEGMSTQLSICEVEVYQEQVFQHEQWTCILPDLEGPMGSLNVARGKPAFQSSTKSLIGSGLPQPASHAVDGDDDPDLYQNKCTHTNQENTPWFVVDMGKAFSIVGVAIVNRGDEHTSRLAQYKIYAGNNNGPSTPFDAAKYEICAKMCEEQVNKGKYYSCKRRIKGRHVAVARYASGTIYQTLCEVQVYTDAVEDVSFPTLNTGLEWKPPHQKLLFDNDEATCINIGKDFKTQRQYLVLHWDPTEKNSPRDDVATYYCQPEFFVNVTHGADVDISVHRGNGTLTGNINNDLLVGSICPIIGRTTIQGLVRSKVKCQCIAKCHVVVKMVLNDEVAIDDRVCALKVYD